MSNENTDVPDIETQDVENSVNNDNNDTLNESNDSDNKDYKTLYENQKKRAEIAESKIKGSSQSPKEADTEQSVASEGTLSREEVILYAKGLSDAEIAQARKVALVNETTLLEAVNDDLFTGWKEKREKQEKLKKATLGSNSRSGKVEAKKSVSESGLSREDHKRLAMEKMNN